MTPETEQPVHACVCGALDERELLAVWHHRASPIFRRMAAHAKRVNIDELTVTIRLIQQLSRGEDVALAPAHAHHSHHLKDCPAAPRNRGRAYEPANPADLVARARRPVPTWKMR